MNKEQLEAHNKELAEIMKIPKDQPRQDLENYQGGDPKRRRYEKLPKEERSRDDTDYEAPKRQSYQQYVEERKAQLPKSFFQKVKARFKTKSRNLGQKTFKNIAKSYGYNKNLSNQLLQYGNAPRQPSPKQLMARQRFAQMSRQRSKNQTPFIKRTGGFTYSPPSYNKNQGKGVWARNNNSPFLSKNPSVIPSYASERYFFEGGKLKRVGDFSN